MSFPFDCYPCTEETYILSSPIASKLVIISHILIELLSRSFSKGFRFGILTAGEGLAVCSVLS